MSSRPNGWKGKHFQSLSEYYAIRTTSDFIYNNTHWTYSPSTQLCHRYEAKCFKCIVSFNSYLTINVTGRHPLQRNYCIYIFQVLILQVFFYPDITFIKASIYYTM